MMSEWYFACSGKYGTDHQHDERTQYPTHPCWGALATHTYHFGGISEITRIAGTLVFGPSEGATVTIVCQLSLNGTSWTTVGSKTAWASVTGVPFDYTVDNVSAAHMRFLSTTANGYVDGSSGIVTMTFDTSDWKYHSIIPIQQSSDGPQTDYQVPIRIYKGSGTNSNGVIYLNDHSEDWPYDIQFTDSEGVLLSHWREVYDATSQYVWVKVNYIGSNTSIILYYGNASAVDMSEGETTFPFFDHFNTLDTSKWTRISGSVTPTISSSILTMTGNGSWTKYISSYTAPATRAVRFRSRESAANNEIGVEPNPCCIDRQLVYNSGYIVTGDDNTSNTVSGYWSYNAWYTFEIQKISGSSSRFYRDNNLSYTSTKIGTHSRPGILGSYTGTLSVDWFLVRKYTGNEPRALIAEEYGIKKIKNLIASIYEDKIKLDWEYSQGADFNRIDLYYSTPTPNTWLFLNTLYADDPTTYTDNIHYGTQFPYETVYYMFISYEDSVNEFEHVYTSIIYPPPKNIINLQITQERANVILEWEHGEGTTPYVDEIYIKEGDNLILLGTLNSDTETFIDTTRLDSGSYIYYLRSRGEITFWSPFTVGSIDFLKVYPQIEFGVGDEALRHAIFSYHNNIEADRNSVLFKVWNKSTENVLEEPTPVDPEVILQGDKYIFIKNIIPYIHDLYDIGTDTEKWRKVYSVNVYSDNSKSAKLKLWNGK